MVKKHVQALAGFLPVHYSCCINSCVCFVGPYKDLTECPNCKEAQFKANGKPHKYFDYIPIIPRLQSMSVNSIHAKKMPYRANHVHVPRVIEDVFDGSHYQSLLNTIVPGGEDNPFSVRPEGSEKTMPNSYKILTLNLNNYKDKH